MVDKIDHKKYLLDTIELLTSGVLSIPEFYEMYYMYFVSTIPNEEMKLWTDDEVIFFAEVQEKLDWTAWENPALLDEESRRYGWMSPEEYVVWVGDWTKKYLETGKATWE